MWRKKKPTALCNLWWTHGHSPGLWRNGLRASPIRFMKTPHFFFYLCPQTGTNSWYCHCSRAWRGSASALQPATTAGGGKPSGQRVRSPENAHLRSRLSPSSGSFSSAWESHGLFGLVTGSVEECIRHVINIVIIRHLIRTLKFLEKFTVGITACVHFFTQPATKPLISTLRSYLYKL